MPCNFFQHTRWIVENPIVRESQDSDTLPHHVCVAFLVMMPPLIRFMRGTIALNYEARLPTIKVSHVIAELMLSSELETQ